jgi:hypothetical protein
VCQVGKAANAQMHQLLPEGLIALRVRLSKANLSLDGGESRRESRVPMFI